MSIWWFDKFSEKLLCDACFQQEPADEKEFFYADADFPDPDDCCDKCGTQVPKQA